ncbi:MAG: hypothetical protein Q8R50_12205 [Sediminibacterium sp.]|nr:hypothetical protein [Sediminibacterium sp.]
MAGKGERFLKRGYNVPKPLIKIGTVPMVIKAVLDLPEATNHTFIVLESHIEDYQIDNHIKTYIPDSTFISLAEVTEGQACTCLLGLESVDANEEILIAACDNGMMFDRLAFEMLKQTADVIVFTFRNNVTVVDKPEQYGWVKDSITGKVEVVSVKKPISENPKFDHAVVGTFWFRHSRIFKEAANKMILDNRRVKNEFYVDECINDAVDLGYNVSLFEIDNYICWGTPDDYSTYVYWESFFSQVQ